MLTTEILGSVPSMFVPYGDNKCRDHRTCLDKLNALWQCCRLQCGCDQPIAAMPLLKQKLDAATSTASARLPWLSSHEARSCC